MNQVTHNTCPKPFRQPLSHAKQLKATYWLTCDQTDGRIVIGLSWMEGESPAIVDWKVPVQIGEKSITVEVFDDKTLKVIGGPDCVVNS